MTLSVSVKFGTGAVEFTYEFSRVYRETYSCRPIRDESNERRHRGRESKRASPFLFPGVLVSWKSLKLIRPIIVKSNFSGSNFHLSYRLPETHPAAVERRKIREQGGRSSSLYQSSIHTRYIPAVTSLPFSSSLPGLSALLVPLWQSLFSTLFLRLSRTFGVSGALVGAWKSPVGRQTCDMLPLRCGRARVHSPNRARRRGRKRIAGKRRGRRENGATRSDGGSDKESPIQSNKDAATKRSRQSVERDREKGAHDPRERQRRARGCTGDEDRKRKS